MIKFKEVLEALFIIDQRFEKSRLLYSVRQGLTLMIPVLLIGSFALIIISLPIPAYQSFMVNTFGQDWKNLFLYVRDGTFGILSLIMAVSISYSYANENNRTSNNIIHPMICSLVSLCSLIALSGFSKEGYSIGDMGVTGVFFAIVTATISSKLFTKLCSYGFLQIKAYTDGASASFNYAIVSIFPASITIGFFAAFNHLNTSVFGISNLQTFISDIYNKMFLNLGISLGSALLFVFLSHLFWFFGVHGNNILEPVAQNMFVPALSVNASLVSNNQAPVEIFTKTFFDTFVFLGGCGSTLCLICAIFICSRYKNLRRHAKVSVLPAIFNINELIVFGIPIVLNVVYVIPFLLIPILLTLISYLAMSYGLVPYTSTLVEWTTPILLGGYTATNSIAGSLLQLFNFLVGIFCYIPFVKLSERRTAFQISNSINKVYDLLNSAEKCGAMPSLISRHDDIGSTSRILAADLEHALLNNKLTLYYHPQVNDDGCIFGVEALLRWNHDIYGCIYPPLAIALANEARLSSKLVHWVLNTACRDFEQIHRQGFNDLTLSLNVSSHELESDNFLASLKEALDKHCIPPQKLQIEITEQLALSGSEQLLELLSSIKGIGVKLAMDDFGMGHTSLKYLQEYSFDTIKIDGSLVREILTNTTCGDIISSIVFLSKSLNFSVTAEYVETEEQRSKLYSLGCRQYQGYLYSRALPCNELISFITHFSNIPHKIKC